MEAITIHPENKEQLKTVKAILKALKVPFETQESSLPRHLENSINRSLDQFAEGSTISFEEFRVKHFQKR